MRLPESCPSCRPEGDVPGRIDLTSLRSSLYISVANGMGGLWAHSSVGRATGS